VKSSFQAVASENNTTQDRLFFLAALFVLFYASILTLSTSVRLHSWEVPFRWMHWIGVTAWLVGFLFVRRQLSKYLPDHDPYLFPAVALLCGWGLLTIWRLDESTGLRQTVWLALSLAVIGFLLRYSTLLVFLRRYKYIWLISGLLLAGLTFFLGTYPGGDGPKEWLGCCGVYLQPSEPLKLLLIIYLSAYLADRLPLNFSLMALIAPTLVLTGAALVILFTQRDLGTASLFIGLYALIIYLAYGKTRLLVFSGAVVLAGGIVGYRLFDVIRLRVDAWLYPWADASGRAYQIVQSLIAVAAGGIFGRGPGMGSPSVVPVAQSDFIFAAISEEMGLIGSLGIILLLALVTCRGLVIALRAQNAYQRYLAAGLTFYLVCQSILIIGGNIRVLPLTGVTLPFVSYGGSSLLTSMVTLLLLLMISNHTEEQAVFYREVKPILFGGTILLIGLAALGVAAVFWGFVSSDDLQSRGDNPRWAIDQRYSARGTILDHNNQLIAFTIGKIGEYSRQVVDPSLGSIIGYTHPIYGQSGLEASMDSYLRGIQGYPASTIILDKLLYSQNPPGLDVRLSLDLTLQKRIDTLLADHTGAMVVLNARTGEILAMASHPSFDPNQLDQNWDAWVNDPQALFLNRATQGQYPVGTALSPFLLAMTLTQGSLPGQPSVTSIVLDGKNWDCATQSTTSQITWAEAITNGCPGAALDLRHILPSDKITLLYDTLGFQTEPQIPLPVAKLQAANITDTDLAALGQAKISVSPLQMALAAAMLSNDGSRPEPRIASAINTPQQGWVILPSNTPSKALLPQGTAAARYLQMNSMPTWQVTATALTSNNRFSWYLAGTVPDWEGTPLAMALLLEEDNPGLAQRIGSTVLKSILEP
jgi:cell division protein FtsW (lipid II flippase)